jgi:hypothetical protein
MTSRLPIETTTLLTLKCGYRIESANEAGTVPAGVAKDGAPINASYRAGSLLLVDDKDQVITGPIDPDGAIELAIAVASLEPRALTNPQTAIIIATAILGLTAAISIERDH